MAGKPKAQLEVTAKDTATPVFKGVERSVKSMASNVSSLMKTMVAGAAAATIGKFFKAAVAESTQAAKEMLGVSNALENIGLKASELAPGLGTLFSDLALKTGQDGGEIATAFTNLLRRTGDYNEALKLLPRSLDVAVARNMDLEAASEAVVKAQEGSAKAIKLVSNTQGAAEQQGQTFVGTLGRMKEGWNNVLQAVGDAIMGNKEMGSSGNMLIDVLVKTEAFIRENEDAIAGFVGAGMKFAGWLANDLVKSFKAFLPFVHDVQRAAITAAIGWEMFGPAVKKGTGFALNALGEFVNGGIRLLNKLPGVEIAEAVMEATGARMMQEAQVHLDALQALYTEELGKVGAPSAPRPKAVRPPAAGRIDGFSGTGRPAGTVKADKPEKVTDAVKEEIKLQQDLLGLEDKKAAAAERLFQIMQEQWAISRNMALSDADRIAARERAEAAAKAHPLDIDLGFDPNAERKPESDGFTVDAPKMNAGQTFMESAGINDLDPDFTANAIDSISELQSAVADLSGGAVGSLGDAFADAFQNAIDGSASLGDALVASTKAAVGAEAQARGRLSFIDAAKSLAAGVMGNPAAFAAAAKYAAAGTAYMGLAAAMGKGGGGGRGGAGSRGAVSERGLKDSRDAGGTSKGDANIVIQGGLLDMTDPRQAAAFANALSDLSGRRVIVSG